MIPHTVTFGIPASIAKGIATGAYEIGAGGVVVKTGTKQVVKWLRPMLDQTAKTVVAKPLVGGLSALAAAPVAVKVGLAVVAVGTASYVGYRVFKWLKGRSADEPMRRVQPEATTPPCAPADPAEPSPGAEDLRGPLTNDPVLAAAFGFGVPSSPEGGSGPTAASSRRSPVEEPT